MSKHDDKLMDGLRESYMQDVQAIVDEIVIEAKALFRKGELTKEWMVAEVPIYVQDNDWVKSYARFTLAISPSWEQSWIMMMTDKNNGLNPEERNEYMAYYAMHQDVMDALPSMDYLEEQVEQEDRFGE